MIGFYIWAMNPVSSEANNVVFTISPGTSKTTVANNLQKAGLIRNHLVLDIYLFIKSPNIQAGDYELSANMKPSTMIEKFQSGDIKINSQKITLIEGKRLEDYAKTFESNLKFTAKEFIQTASDQAFLESLIDKYWFLTEDILNSELYYPLEGYLYPDTYEILENSKPEDVITMLLDHTDVKLSEMKDELLNNPRSIHEILTMASIVEKEANNYDDRTKASQVFYTRLSENWSLGSDVTAFYGARKEMGKDSETWDVLSGQNPYNTRLTDGSMNGKLPIGPICNPEVSSIKAALHPSNTNYYFFVANVCTGEVFFQETSAEFNAKVTELNQICQ